MSQNWLWRCLRCGHEYEERYDPKAPLTERACPRCRSSSVRPLRVKEEAASG